jgi:hypothetical protein
VPLLTVILGIELLALGFGGYRITGSQHRTALIPAYVGAVFAVLGLYSMIMRGSRKHLMHVAAIVSLLGCAGTIPGVIKLVEWVLQDATPDQPAAVVSKSVMSGLCLLFLFTCIESFISARRLRTAQTS